jgi:hypothetical protein
MTSHHRNQNWKPVSGKGAMPSTFRFGTVKRTRWRGGTSDETIKPTVLENHACCRCEAMAKRFVYYVSPRCRADAGAVSWRLLDIHVVARKDGEEELQMNNMSDREFYKEMYRRECAETERLRGLVARNCDPGEAKVLSGPEDAEAIAKIAETYTRGIFK